MTNDERKRIPKRLLELALELFATDCQCEPSGEQCEACECREWMQRGADEIERLRELVKESET